MSSNGPGGSGPRGGDRPGTTLTGLPTASCSPSCRCGDEIVEINESPVPCMTLNEVHSVLSHCEPGPIPIIVSRHPDPQVTSALAIPSPQAHALSQYKDWKETLWVWSHVCAVTKLAARAMAVVGTLVVG